MKYPNVDIDYVHYKVWDELTYPLPNDNGATNEVLWMDK